MVGTTPRVVASICWSPNVRRDGEYFEMLILIIDHCDRYNGRGVLTEPWYLIFLWSLVPIVVVLGISVVFVPSLNLLAIFISTPF